MIVWRTSCSCGHGWRFSSRGGFVGSKEMPVTLHHFLSSYTGFLSPVFWKIILSWSDAGKETNQGWVPVCRGQGKFQSQPVEARSLTPVLGPRAAGGTSRSTVPCPSCHLSWLDRQFLKRGCPLSVHCTDGDIQGEMLIFLANSVRETLQPCSVFGTGLQPQ